MNLAILKEVRVQRRETDLDKVAFKFAEALEKYEIRYAVVAGYVAVALGRPRTTDDIDFIVKVEDPKIILSSAEDAGFKLLTKIENLERDFQNTSIRFYLPPYYLPNVEVKRARNRHHFYAIENRIRFYIGKSSIYIGPLEHQIAYKLYLGTNKDLEDAYFIWRLLRNKLSMDEIKKWAKEIGAEGRLWILKR